MPAIHRFLNVDSVIPGTSNPINGYNLFAYCLNNPIIYEDPSGNFPNIIKRIVHSVKTLFSPILAFASAVEINVGGGIGIGGSVSTNYKGVRIGVEAVIKSSDSLRINRSGISGQHKSIAQAEISVGTYKNTKWYGTGHSYQDPDCTCSWIDSTFKEKMECPANETPVINIENAKLEVGISAYFILGFEASISIDLKEVEENLYVIFEETMKYED